MRCFDCAYCCTYYASGKDVCDREPQEKELTHEQVYEQVNCPHFLETDEYGNVIG